MMNEERGETYLNDCIHDGLEVEEENRSGSDPFRLDLLSVPNQDVRTDVRARKLQVAHLLRNDQSAL